MKKVLFILFNLLTFTVMAQTKGRFELHNLADFTLHWAMQVTSLRARMHSSLWSSHCFGTM